MAFKQITVPRDEDLAWLFHRSDAASGMASSFGVLVDAAMGGWGGGGSHEGRITDRRFGARGEVARARALRTRFIAMPASTKDALWLAYGPHAWPRETERHFGDYAGVCLLTDAAERGYTAAAGKKGGGRGLGAWLVSCCVRGETSTLEAVRREAEAKVAVALATWWGLRARRSA